MKNINSISKFNTLLETKNPVVLDFHATWCPP